MSGISRASKIDLRFGDLARAVVGFRVGVGPGNLKR
jgi:hypothetical protein